MLKLINVNRRLGSFALSDINLDVVQGEYYVLLGRSGSGKTQLLELIAGLEHPDSGKILLDNEDITTRRIQDRKIGIVFQDYAVFPHMTVFGNIAYPLRARKEDIKTIRSRVERAAENMNISHLLERRTEKLSGGELQRVALARTLITAPRLLLLDEPLSSLDTALKDDLRRLLRNLNKAGQTIIHVTHDYSDAISLAKRVGVLHNGRIIQEGTVGEVFSKPSNRFVARYAGIRNFFRIDITGSDGELYGISDHKNRFHLACGPVGNDRLMILKNESISLATEPPLENGLNVIRGRIAEIIPSESGMEVTIDAGDIIYKNIRTSEFDNMDLKEGREIWVIFSSDAIVVLNSN